MAIVGVCSSPLSTGRWIGYSIASSPVRWGSVLMVKATYRDGVLEIKLPKVETVKPKEIKIDVL